MRSTFAQLILCVVAASAAIVPSVPTQNGTYVRWEGDMEIVDLSEVIANLPPAELETSPAQVSKLDKRNWPTMCYNGGTKIDRRWAISAIDTFCNGKMGQHFPTGRGTSVTYTFGNRVPETMIIALEPINGCPNTVDGNCYALLRQPIDRCNTGGENGKQGGYANSPCAMWRADPGRSQTNCKGCYDGRYGELSFHCPLMNSNAQRTCYSQAANNARNECIRWGECCERSGLGVMGDNCWLNPWTNQ